jgi:pimeloyl-ACP methyl ester carboxylesterase
MSDSSCTCSTDQINRKFNPTNLHCVVLFKNFKVFSPPSSSFLTLLLLLLIICLEVSSSSSSEIIQSELRHHPQFNTKMNHQRISSRMSSFIRTFSNNNARMSSSSSSLHRLTSLSQPTIKLSTPSVSTDIGLNDPTTTVPLRIRTTSATTRLFTTRSVHCANGTTSNSTSNGLSIANTPLGTPSASHLLKGLDVYEVPASDDGHPLCVYGIHSSTTSPNWNENRKPILLLHGRTWSSVPVYHLLGGTDSNDDCKSRSLIEALYDHGLQPYAMDFRGFGGTPSDKTNSVIPSRCVGDVESVLSFITNRHSPNNLPTLLGWSQGALVAQLVAQKSPNLLSKLVLYGSIYDPLVRYPRVPLYSSTSDIATIENPDNTPPESRRKNTFNEAIEDFTVEGSIPPKPAASFAHAALLTDPYKAQWKYLCQFNNVDPARVHVPTLVVAGDKDPYAPLRVQAELFSNLARGVDRTWSIIADADHAVHLLNSGRHRFVNIVKGFVENGERADDDGVDLNNQC